MSSSSEACVPDSIASLIFDRHDYPGGDAAALSPTQAAAGFLYDLNDARDMTVEPFSFGRRYEQARQLPSANIRVFSTTSVGRLFETVAALLGFEGDITFEAQAAIWLEQLAARSGSQLSIPFEFQGEELDFRPGLAVVIESRRRGRDPSDIARAFHRGLASGILDAVRRLCATYDVEIVVLSGGVFQNELLVTDVCDQMRSQGLRAWLNQKVPPNDGGLSLGQAALASCIAYNPSLP